MTRYPMGLVFGHQNSRIFQECGMQLPRLDSELNDGKYLLNHRNSLRHIVQLVDNHNIFDFDKTLFNIVTVEQFLFQHRQSMPYLRYHKVGIKNTCFFLTRFCNPILPLLIAQGNTRNFLETDNFLGLISFFTS